MRMSYIHPISFFKILAFTFYIMSELLKILLHLVVSSEIDDCHITVFTLFQYIYIYIYIYIYGGARGVMVIVVGNGHGDKSSNPGRD